MKAKGSIFKSIEDFVKTDYASNYQQWKGNLSNESRSLTERAKNAEWYPIHDALIDPIKVICSTLDIDEKTCAWNSGRFSAEQSLNGVYKVFIMVSTPAFILKRAPRILPTFYDPSDLKTLETTEKGVFIRCDILPVKHTIIEYRIAGWIERAGEICGCKNMKVEITESLAMGGKSLDITASWD